MHPMGTQQSEQRGVGVEGWIATSAIALMFLHMVPALAAIYTFSMIAGIAATVSGAISTLLAFKDDTGWLSAVLPIGLLGWGLSALFHLPPH